MYSRHFNSVAVYVLSMQHARHMQQTASVVSLHTAAECRDATLCVLCSDGKGAFACINPVGGEINLQLAKAVRDGGTLLLFALLGSDKFEVRCIATSACLEFVLIINKPVDTPHAAGAERMSCKGLTCTANSLTPLPGSWRLCILGIGPRLL